MPDNTQVSSHAEDAGTTLIWSQINEALDYAINHSPVSLNKLSPDGKLLIEDVRDILET